MKKTLDKIVVSLKKVVSTIDDSVNSPHDTEATRVVDLLKNGWKRSNLDTSRYALFERGSEYFVFDKLSHKIAVEYIGDRVHLRANQEYKIKQL